MGRYPNFRCLEIERMEELFWNAGWTSLNQKFYQSLVEKFNRALDLAGEATIDWKEVQNLFENKPQNGKAKNSSFSSMVNTEKSPNVCHVNGLVDLHVGDTPVGEYLDSCALRGQRILDGSELRFEARSATDWAWYDVSTFVAHRVLDSGEMEVRVRYVGFGATEDEWVDVRTALRRSSVPLESSECGKVKPGDHVLCFREGNDKAAYFDVHILAVERKRHDIRGCRCHFLVHYIHDKTKEKVTLAKLCVRPGHGDYPDMAQS